MSLKAFFSLLILKIFIWSLKKIVYMYIYYIKNYIYNFIKDVNLWKILL